MSHLWGVNRQCCLGFVLLLSPFLSQHTFLERTSAAWGAVRHETKQHRFLENIVRAPQEDSIGMGPTMYR